MNTSTDTIVALATPPGTGGIGVVRLSGPDAARIGRAMAGSLPEPRRTARRSFVSRDGTTLDDGLVAWFEAPHSFTGEDVVELHGHGGPVVTGMLVDAAVELGARLAAPGEFSKRAFLNDKIDLAQAEAIADLIDSGTTQAARAALRSLRGEFSAAVNDLVSQLTNLRVYVEAAIDFPEEEVDFLDDERLRQRLAECAANFDSLKDNATAGRVLRDGFQVVLVGRPNAGKSSLMNRLSGEETAIVTEIAGTTRDVLRERIDIDGLAVDLVDTAGLREDPGVVEKEGIRRALAAMQESDAVIWVQDATDDEVLTGETSLADVPEGTPVLVVRNKIDLPSASTAHSDAVEVSAATGAGLDELRARIAAMAGYRNLGEGALTARRRHVDALSRAARHFAEGRSALDATGAGELLAEELRLAQQALGEITGEVSADDLLGAIFSEFCIGK